MGIESIERPSDQGASLIEVTANNAALDAAQELMRRSKEYTPVVIPGIGQHDFATEILHPGGITEISIHGEGVYSTFIVSKSKQVIIGEPTYTTIDGENMLRTTADKQQHEERKRAVENYLANPPLN